MIDRDKALLQLDIVQAALDALRETVTSRTVTLLPGQSIQAAVNDPAIDTILLSDGVYEGAVTIPRRLILRAATPLPGLSAITPATAPPLLLTSTATATLTITGPDVVVSGVTIQNGVPANTLIDVTGEGTVLDRVVGRGDPAKGQHRGIAANGVNTQVLGCWVDECWLPGRDAQALCGWKGTRNLLVKDCYLAGGAQAVMFGGADTASADQIPRGIRIEGCRLTKNPGWYRIGAQIKCALELKNAIDVAVTGCELEYAGTSEGQAGYLLVLTPRNQSGGSPWSTVQDVVIEKSVCRYGGGVVNLMGSDDKFPSGPLSRVAIRDLTVTDLDPLDPGLFPGTYKGSGRVIQIQRGTAGVTIERWVAIERMKNMRAGVYVMGTPPVWLTLRDLELPACSYGVKIDAGGAGAKALVAYAPGTVVEKVTAGGVVV